MDPGLILIFIVLGIAALVVGIAVAVALPLSLVLMGVLALQLVGVLKRVPIKYNLRNLVVRWKTTALTALCFILVVGLLTVMLAFVNGLYLLTQNSGVPGNVIVLSDGANDETFSNLGFGDVTAIQFEPGIRSDDGKPMVSFEVYGIINQPILVRECPKCGGLVPVDRLGRSLEAHAPKPPLWYEPLLHRRGQITGVVLGVVGAALAMLAAWTLGGLRSFGSTLASVLASLLLGVALAAGVLVYVELPWLPRERGDVCSGSGASVAGSRGRRFLQLRGMEDAARSARVHNLAIQGEGFGSAGVRPLPGSTKGEQAIEAVIGEGLARELGPDQGKDALQVGDLFSLGSRQWVIVGILKSGGSTFDSEVWAKFSIVSEQLGKNTYTTCVIRTDGPETAASLARNLTENFKTPAVIAQTEPEYYAKLNGTNQQFLFAIALVVLIISVGSVFGVMNTMFAAIAQRTKDVGVLRIIGYTRWQVLTSFFLEALALAVIGGAIGCAVGSLAHGHGASSIISSGQGGGKSVVLHLVVDWRVLGAGMLFSVFLGCMGGLLPALSAMRLKALDSLR
jgi:hypothetical protein